MIGEMASATAGEANRTPATARTTTKDKATTPRTASSCAESSTDTTATSTSTCRRGDSGHTQPDAEEGAGRKGQYRQQPYQNGSVARWSRGHPPEQQRAPQPQGHGPGPGAYADRFPGGRGHESNRPHPSGERGRGRGGGVGQLPPPNLPPGHFLNGPRHAFLANYPYCNGYMGYSGWGAAAVYWSPPPEDAYGYGLATYERSLGESPYGDVGGRYGFGHPPDDGGYYQQQRETTGENSNYGLSAAGPDAFQPRPYGDGYDIPVGSGTPQQHQHQHQQDGTPPATSTSAATPSPAPGAAPANGAPLQLFIARS